MFIPNEGICVLVNAADLHGSKAANDANCMMLAIETLAGLAEALMSDPECCRKVNIAVKACDAMTACSILLYRLNIEMDVLQADDRDMDKLLKTQNRNVTDGCIALVTRIASHARRKSDRQELAKTLHGTMSKAYALLKSLDISDDYIADRMHARLSKILFSDENGKF